MAEEVQEEFKVEDGVAVGLPNNPEPANETDAVVFSDEEREDYERFGATPAPEHPNFGSVEHGEKSKEEKPEENEPKEEEKSEAKPTTPSTPTTPSPSTPSVPKG